jgi:uncharacterized protein YebE (UPF0316 family)
MTNERTVESYADSEQAEEFEKLVIGYMGDKLTLENINTIANITTYAVQDLYSIVENMKIDRDIDGVIYATSIGDALFYYLLFSHVTREKHWKGVTREFYEGATLHEGQARAAIWVTCKNLQEYLGGKE